MYIKEIKLNNFRNFKEKSYKFEQGINIIYGDSGSGKSNLLHSIIIAMNGSNISIPDMPHIRFAPTDAHFQYRKEKETYVKDIFWPEITCNAFLDKEYEWTMFKFNHTASTMIDNKPNPDFGDINPIFNYFYSHIENRDLCEYRKVLNLLTKFMNEFENCKIVCDDYQLEVVYINNDDICGARYLNAGRRKLMNLFVAIATQMQIANFYNQKFNEVPGIVLIDNIETFVHARWQLKLLDVLSKYFPNVQFIVTTHSPIILSSTHANCIGMNGHYCDCYGLSIDDIIVQILGSQEFPDRIKNQIKKFNEYIDNGELQNARDVFIKMKIEMNEHSTELTKLNVALDFEEM